MIDNIPLSSTLLFIIFFSACILFGILWEIFRRRCPKCGKFFARTIIKGSSTTHYSGSYNETHKSTNYNCTCKYCGHEWRQHYTSTKHKK